MKTVLIVSACLLAAAPAAASAAPPEPRAPTADAAWTAKVRHFVVARARPSAASRAVARLEPVTRFWRRPQRLLVLGRVRTDPATGQRWVPVRLPDRPNRSMGFLRVSEVDLAVTRTRIVVRVGARRVELWRAGRREASWRAAVGTSGTPTPRGLFAVQDPVPSQGAQRSYLGPYIITLTAYSPVLTSFMGGNGLVAIHGTDATGLLGRAVSHGCVRVANDAVSRLYRVATPGVPVEIRA
ncbi:L,D-transpeptidase [Miltoncostaea marina]|uniref:L,D-transpeptidase n=1 Tax=Miltoncostaea marina TaxID=2843215 RepID=UPI001C3E4D57|nr:L,D-transpeptidase [Miltoncostaea marina]